MVWLQRREFITLLGGAALIWHPVIEAWRFEDGSTSPCAPPVLVPGCQISRAAFTRDRRKFHGIIGRERSCRLGRTPRGNPADGNHSGAALHQVREQLRQALEFAVRPGGFDCNKCPTRAASEAGFSDHSVRLMKWRERHSLRGRCEGRV
jgi:hypothetical protein